MQTIRWGILGCGDVAEKKSGPALYQAPHSVLHAVMRRDRAKAEDFARRHGAVRAYDTVDDLLGDPDVDAVYIATPPHLHCSQTLLAARAGKHVLVEKPMALDLSECQTMIAACREAGVSLHVAYYRRFYPKFVYAKKLLDEGAIGRVLGAHLFMAQRSPGGGWRVDPKLSGGGHFVDVGSHRLDMVLFLLGGDVLGAAGWAQNQLGTHTAENDVTLSFQTTTGAVVSAGFHFHTQPSRDVLEIVGSKGTLRFDPFDGEAFSVFSASSLSNPSGETTHTYPNPTPAHLPFIAALVEVYNGSPLPHVTGEEGAKTTRLMDAALADFRAQKSHGMDKALFAARLEEATQKVITFTRDYVLDELPNSARYLIIPNASYDGNPLKFDEEVFPQDRLPDGQKHLPVTNADGVVNFLWRNGKVPEWINISVADADTEHSYLSLTCCGRYTAGEGLYHVGASLPPFHVLSPPLPKTWHGEPADRHLTVEQHSAKYGKFRLPKGLEEPLR